MFKRNLAISQVQNLKRPEPAYTTWTLKKAVAEGYSVNVWVYRAVKLIVNSMVSIPWIVRREGEVQENHHLTALFNYPNTSISSNDLNELLNSWLQLAGNAYCIKVKEGMRTTELWPVSPDRMDPVQSTDVEEWIHSYILDKNNKRTRKEYDPTEILHLKFFNPANPLVGISPLEAAAKVVDVDNDQMSWSKSTMQSRGVVDGVFTFERPFESIEEAEDIAKIINKKYTGKDGTRLAALGGNAKYHRTALTPQEADYGNSRKDNRDEIFIAFGVPPQLGGSQESSTYNNFEVSSLIFWFSTLIPILDDIKSAKNFSFADELMPGEVISYDLSGVQAIRKAMLDRAETAEILFRMGVPFEAVNRIFDFGVDEFTGWEKSYVNQTRDQTTPAEGSGTPSERSDNHSTEDKKIFTLIEYRDTQDDIEKEVVKQAKAFGKLLDYQQKVIFAAIDGGKGTDAEKIIGSTEDKWIELMDKLYLETGVTFGAKIIAESLRQTTDPLTLAIEEYLAEEVVVLTELSLISSTTSAIIVQHVKEGLKEGFSTADIQQAIMDSGTFSEARALRLARTITGNAANLGQLLGAEQTGATHKTWQTAGFEVRDTHEVMQGVKVKMGSTFTVGGATARYPLDNRLPPAERVNCRCSMTFSIE